MARIPATIAAGRKDNGEYTLAAAQTFKTGSLVLRNGSGNITECGADPTVIFGWALGEAQKLPDTTKQIVCRATEESRAWMQASSDPAAANSGVAYGVAKDADGIWYVDFTDTTATRVYVHEVDTATKRVLVSVLAANRQSAP